MSVIAFELAVFGFMVIKVRTKGPWMSEVLKEIVFAQA